jgi:hypothetical protein
MLKRRGNLNAVMQNTTTNQTITIHHPLTATDAEAVAHEAGKAEFASITYRAKRNGELARHTIILGARYDKQVTASVDQLMTSIALGTAVDVAKLSDRLDGLVADGRLMGDKPSDLDALVAEAAKAVLVSLTKTAKGEQDGYTKVDTYTTVAKGVTLHKADGSLELHGLRHAKVVLEAGDPETGRTRALTVAKNMVRATLPVGRYRTFSLEAVATVKRNGDTLELA